MTNTQGNDRVFTEKELTKFFGFLDALRETGTMNMFGASEVLRDVFELTKTEARSVWVAWTETYK